jgi:hypothetical protein
MDALWSYFWPAFAVGLAIGAIAGTVTFRQPLRRAKDKLVGDTEILRAWRRKRRLTLLCGVLATIAAAALWHGPLGGADQFSSRVERGARQALDYYEMTKVTAQLQRNPLSRRLILRGPADDFQRGELVRVFNQLPGVSSVGWSERRAGLPLLGEAALIACAGFLLGLLLAYLVELRRRYNAQWKW